LNTPEDQLRSCAIANVGVKKSEASELAEILLKRIQNLFPWQIDGAECSMVAEISPQFIHVHQGLDEFVRATKALA